MERDLLEIGRSIHAAYPSHSRSPLRALDERAMGLAATDDELRAALFRLVDVTPACRSLDDLAAHLAEYVGEMGGDRVPQDAGAVGVSPAGAERAGGEHPRQDAGAMGVSPAGAEGAGGERPRQDAGAMGVSPAGVEGAGREHPLPIAAAMRMSHTRAGRTALGAAAAAGVRHMAHRFIVGESPHKAARALRALWDEGMAASLDLLGEATVTVAEADRYAERCAQALDTKAESVRGWPARPLLEADSLGSLPRVNVCVKVSALTPLLRPEAPARGRDDAARRLRPLLRRAREHGAHLHIDMESLDTVEATSELVFALLDEEEFRDGPSAGVVLQAYLRESPLQLDALLEWSRSSPRRPPLVVRLVKGAYWDHEVIEARQHGWNVPVFEDKADCDRNYEELTRRLIDARPLIRPAIASHNLRSVSHAIAYNRSVGGEDRDLELQVLRGLGDDLGSALASLGFRVRVYCPVGELVAGMAYLVRRLLENTANDSFLGDQQRGVPIEELLAAP